MVPPHWTANCLSSFLTRSFEKMLHEQCESKIMKSINAEQNIVVCLYLFMFILVFVNLPQIKEKTWLILRQHGMLIEEAVNGGNEELGNHTLAEKLALQMGDLTSNILVNSKEK